MVLEIITLDDYKYLDSIIMTFCSKFYCTLINIERAWKTKGEGVREGEGGRERRGRENIDKILII